MSDDEDEMMIVQESSSVRDKVHSTLLENDHLIQMKMNLLWMVVDLENLEMVEWMVIWE